MSRNSSIVTRVGFLIWDSSLANGCRLKQTQTLEVRISSICIQKTLYDLIYNAPYIVHMCNIYIYTYINCIYTRKNQTMEIIKFQLSNLTASKAVQASTWHVATMVVDLPASASALLWKYIMLTFHLSNIFENQKTWWENRFFLSSYWILNDFGILANDTQHPHSLNKHIHLSELSLLPPCQVHWKCIWMVKCISMFGIQVPCRWSFVKRDQSDPGNQRAARLDAEFRDSHQVDGIPSNFCGHFFVQ